MRADHVLAMVSATILLPFDGASTQESSEAWVERIEAPQYFAVLVEDVERSVSWYQTALGLRKLNDSEAEDGRWRIEPFERCALRGDHS
jgi:hypothetical protein